MQEGIGKGRRRQCAQKGHHFSISRTISTIHVRPPVEPQFGLGDNRLSDINGCLARPGPVDLGTSGAVTRPSRLIRRHLGEPEPSLVATQAGPPAGLPVGARVLLCWRRGMGDSRAVLHLGGIIAIDGHPVGFVGKQAGPRLGAHRVLTFKAVAQAFPSLTLRPGFSCHCSKPHCSCV